MIRTSLFGLLLLQNADNSCLHLEFFRCCLVEVHNTACIEMPLWFSLEVEVGGARPVDSAVTMTERNHRNFFIITRFGIIHINKKFVLHIFFHCLDFLCCLMTRQWLYVAIANTLSRYTMPWISTHYIIRIAMLLGTLSY